MTSRHFLKGPIPWWWIERAAALPGEALTVALVIWLWVGMRRSQTIRLSARHVFPGMRVSRYAVYRGLDALEQARLITCRRRRGHPPLITVILSTARVAVLSSRRRASA
jgi:hypothetical protein